MRFKDVYPGMTFERTADGAHFVVVCKIAPATVLADRCDGGKEEIKMRAADISEEEE
jgi:hypothetical protein